jgi:hypothetical protein
MMEDVRELIDVNSHILTIFLKIGVRKDKEVGLKIKVKGGHHG